MNKGRTIFSQIMSMIPERDFKTCVDYKKVISPFRTHTSINRRSESILLQCYNVTKRHLSYLINIASILFCSYLTMSLISFSIISCSNSFIPSFILSFAIEVKSMHSWSLCNSFKIYHILLLLTLNLSLFS